MRQLRAMRHLIELASEAGLVLGMRESPPEAPESAA